MKQLGLSLFAALTLILTATPSIYAEEFHDEEIIEKEKSYTSPDGLTNRFKRIRKVRRIWRSSTSTTTPIPGGISTSSSSSSKITTSKFKFKSFSTSSSSSSSSSTSTSTP